MTPLRRRLALLVVLLAAGGWEFAHRHAGGSAGSTLLAVTQAVPDRLQLGSLTLEPCDIGKRRAGATTVRAYCAAVQVPEDWDAPAARSIRLRVAIVRPEVPQADADLVAFLDGGPGGAATEDYPAIDAAFEPLRRRHLLLLIDQRGTGGSNALDCAAHDAAPGLPPAPPLARPDAAGERAAGLAQLRACLQRLAPRAAPQFYTTSAAARDLEAVRQLLGAPPLDLIGVSYGTRLAQQYARAFPQAVRTIVLDSPVPNDLVLGSEHARNLEQELRELAARCRAEVSCAQRYGDPYQTLYRVRARLQAQPQRLELRDPYTFDSGQRQLGADALAQLMRFYAYSPLTAALIPYVLKEADDGHYAPLLGQTQLVIGDVEDHVTGGMALSVLCAEDADELRIAPEDAGTIMGNDLTQWLQAACAIWPHATRPAGFREPLRGGVPVLVLAGEHDPVTPPRYGEAIVRSLGRARLLRLTGQGHAVLGAGCMPRLVAEFVRSADPQALDASCLEVLEQAPLFLDANGTGP